MQNRVFIISKSEIIRSGLRSIIKKHFNYQIFEFFDIKLMQAHNSAFNKTDFIFIENYDDPYTNKMVRKYKSTGALIIGIYSGYTTINNTVYDHTIDIYTAATDILNIISEPDQTLNPVQAELTSRETDVLKLIAFGNSNKEIADKLFISTHTVISHRKNITEKLGIKSISGLTVYAILNNIIDTENINPESLI